MQMKLMLLNIYVGVVFFCFINRYFRNALLLLFLSSFSSPLLSLKGFLGLR